MFNRRLITNEFALSDKAKPSSEPQSRSNSKYIKFSQHLHLTGREREAGREEGGGEGEQKQGETQRKERRQHQEQKKLLYLSVLYLWCSSFFPEWFLGFSFNFPSKIVHLGHFGVFGVFGDFPKAYLLGDPPLTEEIENFYQKCSKTSQITI